VAADSSTRVAAQIASLVMAALRFGDRQPGLNQTGAVQFNRCKGSVRRGVQLPKP